MQKYRINWDRGDYGHIDIEAQTIEEARELFESGEWEEKDLFIKNGGFYVESVQEI